MTEKGQGEKEDIEYNRTRVRETARGSRDKTNSVKFTSVPSGIILVKSFSRAREGNARFFFARRSFHAKFSRSTGH